MAKRRTYEEKLLDDLSELPANRWFRIDNRPEVEKMTKAIKDLINANYPFIFSEDFTKIRRDVSVFDDKNYINDNYRSRKDMPAGVTVEKIEKGTQQSFIGHKGKTITMECSEHYLIKFENRIIAIES